MYKKWYILAKKMCKLYKNNDSLFIKAAIYRRIILATHNPCWPGAPLCGGTPPAKQLSGPRSPSSHGTCTSLSGWVYWGQRTPGTFGGPVHTSATAVQYRLGYIPSASPQSSEFGMSSSKS